MNFNPMNLLPYLLMGMMGQIMPSPQPDRIAQQATGMAFPGYFPFPMSQPDPSVVMTVQGLVATVQGLAASVEMLKREVEALKASVIEKKD